ncbi:MAG: hypothetical protein ACRDRM_03790 [Pseudonocardiaceae bacterium]
MGEPQLLTSHYLEEIEALAQRVVVLGSGQVLADGSLDDVREAVALSTVSLRAAGLPALAGIARCRRDGDRFELQTPDADQLVRDLVHSGVAFHDLQVPSSCCSRWCSAADCSCRRTSSRVG